MLYKKNTSSALDLDLFKNPTAEYRGTPFWAWNCDLEQKELEWQLDVLKKMGFGGAHMHVRVGMSTPYLSDEFMELIKACVEKSKKEDMLAWLYDEDCWPSGYAGGLLTKDRRYRARYLAFTPFAETADSDIAQETIPQTEDCRFLACYDVELDKEGCLVSWKKIDKDTPAQYEKWYAYVKLQQETPRYNNQTYVNTLDKETIDKFIEITYDRYQDKVGEEFGKTIPAMFTDEPQFNPKETLGFATQKAEVKLPWTDDLPTTFAEVYEGEDLLGGLPELIWERADKQPSLLRYHYHDHVCERFVEAFSDNCGDWCEKHGLEFTGHMMNEATLKSQTMSIGEAMRCYRKFGIPGIDMLCAKFEYNTAKQTQSAVHQYGREGMMSELYGVTNWDFDFRGHKLHGDWQAALGVTVRVPHLSWVSMAGEAKRDYPASIHYQSPWWEKYSLIEDHFARLNTVLTRGKPIVKVGMIHPVESYWLHWGPSEQTALVRDDMDNNFDNITKWLLFGGIDFDFISESLLPELCEKPSAPLQVGEMAYDVILVPQCETLRSTTLERLEAFAKAGGRLIFIGELPTLEDARPSKRGKLLAQKAQCIAMNQSAVLKALESERLLEMRNETGGLASSLLYQLRQDGEGRWLFIARGKEAYNKHVSINQNLRIRIKGHWNVVLYDTMKGETAPISQCIKGNETEITYCLYAYDSLLLWLEPIKSVPNENTEQNSVVSSTEKKPAARKVKIPKAVSYTLSEPNVLLLDKAEFALDDGEWNAEEEILRLDDACRRTLNWPSRKTRPAQPWVIEEEPITHTVHLRFHIQSEIAYEGAKLAIEDAEQLKITWNGEAVDNTVLGWYVDKSIKTVALPMVQVGENILEVSIPFGKRSNVEWAYLLGDFGVEVFGQHTCIIPARKELVFGDITRQGLPFYGGNITYHIPIETSGGNVSIRSGYYLGVLQEVSVDSGKEIPMIYPPYKESLGVLEAGKHTVDLTLYGHRKNSFGPIHLKNLKETWIGPGAWRTAGDRWCYEYMLSEEGIMVAPDILEE